MSDCDICGCKELDGFRHTSRVDCVNALRYRLAEVEVQRDKLREAIWPGLPKWTPTPEQPQQDFYEAVAEGFRAEKEK